MIKITIILLCGVSLLVSGDTGSVLPESAKSKDALNIVIGPVTPGPVQNETTTADPTTTKSPPPPPPTTTPPPPPPPTPPPTTTTTTTTQKTTTTVKPTPPPTTTTTVAPSTTTVKPHPPAPLPEPTPGTWKVNDTKQVCLIAQMAIQVHVDFVKDNKTMKTEFNIPVDNKTVTASGFCGSSEQNLTLTWPCDKNVTGQGNDSLILHFVKNDTQKHYSLHHLEIILAPHHFFNSSAPLKLVHKAQQFSTGLTNSYRCFKSQKMNLTVEDAKSNDTVVGFLKVSDLQFQAFRTDNNTAFGLAEDCAFDTPDIVPIVVGCALAALVVIVLIAYLVGRRRRNAQGYSSM